MVGVIESKGKVGKHWLILYKMILLALQILTTKGIEEYHYIIDQESLWMVQRNRGNDLTNLYRNIVVKVKVNKCMNMLKRRWKNRN